jgi:ABC-2 type transport system permease protein
MFDLRLIKADALKLRRRRGMLSLAILGTLGIVVLVFTVTAIQHAGNPAKYGPAGGLDTYREAMAVLGLLALVFASIVGATAGTQDLETGVFRDLAATGRSRLALFGSRLSGALVVSLPIVLLAAAVAAGASVALAGSLPTPDAGTIASGTAGVVAATVLGVATSVGVAALVGSRGPVIGILLAFYLAVQQLLMEITFLGNAREAIPSVAINRISGLPGGNELHLALGTAIAVVAAWGAAALAAGAWRTRTREI